MTFVLWNHHYALTRSTVSYTSFIVFRNFSWQPGLIFSWTIDRFQSFQYLGWVFRLFPQVSILSTLPHYILYWFIRIFSKAIFPIHPSSLVLSKSSQCPFFPPRIGFTLSLVLLKQGALTFLDHWYRPKVYIILTADLPLDHFFLFPLLKLDNHQCPE